MNKTISLAMMILILSIGLAFAVQLNNEGLVSHLVVNNVDGGQVVKPPIMFNFSGNSLNCGSDVAKIVIATMDGNVLNSYSLFINKTGHQCYDTYEWDTTATTLSDGVNTYDYMSDYEQYYNSPTPGNYHHIFGYYLNSTDGYSPGVLVFYPNGTFYGLYGWENTFAGEPDSETFYPVMCKSTVFVGRVEDECLSMNSSKPLNVTNITYGKKKLPEGKYRYIIIDGNGRWPDMIWTQSDPFNIDNTKPSLDLNVQKNNDVVTISIDARDVGATRSNVYELLGELDVNPPGLDIVKYTGSKYILDQNGYWTNSHWNCQKSDDNWTCALSIPMWNDPYHFPIGRHTYYSTLYDFARNSNGSSESINYSFTGFIPHGEQKYILLDDDSSDETNFIPEGVINNSLIFFNGGTKAGTFILILEDEEISGSSVVVHNIDKITPTGYDSSYIWPYPNGNTAFEINVSTDAKMVLCVNYSGYAHADKLLFFKKIGGKWVRMNSVKKDGIMCTQIESAHTPYMAARYDTCSDGTPYGQCSSEKPLYCDNGNLVDNCDTCGCPSGNTCNGDGTCRKHTGGGGGGFITNYCGDGTCQASENCTTCPQDCGTCPSVCGNGIVENGEDCDGGSHVCLTNGYVGTQKCVNCTLGPCETNEKCGDGVCNGPETEGTCPEDCKPKETKPVCGNGVCEKGEEPYDPTTGTGCLPDCGSVAGCGDGICQPSENCSTCATDCGECPTSGPTGFAVLRNPGIIIPTIVVAGAVLYWIFFVLRKGKKRRRKR